MNLKKIALAIVVFASLFAAAPARAQLSQATVLTDINQQLLSCGNGCNTAATLRGLLDVLATAIFQVQGSNGTFVSGTSLTSSPLTWTALQTFSAGAVVNGTSATFGLTTPVHLITGQTTPPALTSCGTGSPAITGSDTSGIVTMGTSAAGCVITFNVAYVLAPYCVVTWIATPLASQSYVVSNVAITLTQTSTSGNKVQYFCVAQAGG